jgi:hypothetical protein
VVYLLKKVYEWPTCLKKPYKWLTCIGLKGPCTFFMEPTSLGLHFYILLIQKINQFLLLIFEFLLFYLYNTYDTSLSTTMLVLGKIDKPHQ